MLNPTIALLAWPVVALWLFARLPFERAIIWSVLASYLFLPSSIAIDLPGLPPLEKQSLPNLMLLAIVLAKAPRSFRLLPPHPIARLLLVMLVAGSFLTAMTNQDPIWLGGRVLPGLAPYDALSDTVRTILGIVPFLIGWQYLANADTHREILKALVAAGFAYSVLMLYEVRMSPQLHIMIYGYFPHDFSQQFRWGGFRPVVFLSHGLVVAFFALTITLAAAALWRDTAERTGEAGTGQPSNLYGYATGYFAVVLALCKSLGTLVYGVLLLPVALLLKPRRQLLIAAALAVVTLSYPVLRGVHLVPTEALLEWAAGYGSDREESLRVRFDNEERLLAHAEERPLFGWGGWGRNRVYDTDTGIDISTTDGYWAIVIGTSGWLGYLATFGMLGMPILLLWIRTRRPEAMQLTRPTAALALILGINMFELLPNATLMPWTWLIAGAMLGHVLQKQEAGSAHDAGLACPAPARPRTVL